MINNNIYLAPEPECLIGNINKDLGLDKEYSEDFFVWDTLHLSCVYNVVVTNLVIVRAH